MFGPARLASESARRTQQLSLQERLSRLVRMQSSDSGRPATTEVYPCCCAPSSTSARAREAQPGRTPAGHFGQELGLPRFSSYQPQRDIRSQCPGPSYVTHRQRSGIPQPGGQSTGFPHPPTTFSRSYHTSFPSLTSSSASIWQKNSPADANVGVHSRSPMEQSQAQPKRSLNSSSVDSKKLCLEGSGSALDYKQASSASQTQRRDEDAGITPSNSEERSTSAKPVRPDISKFMRRWKLTPVGEKQRHRRRRKLDVEVSVLCYNVLAQCLIESNDYLYHHCTWDILKWEYRRKNLLQELHQADSDIICLQEVQASHYNDFFLPELEKLGYGAIYQKRTGDKHDGCAIFYKTDKFTLEDSKQVRFYRPDIRLLDRDNVAIIALLRPRWPSANEATKLCVATTHLLYNPKRGDIKLAQLGVLLAEIDRMAAVQPLDHQNPAYHPVILCGDFNSVPHSPLYNFIRHRRLDYVGLQKVTISGQGSSRRSSDFLNWPLWPFDVGVTDACQFRSVVRERLRNNGNNKQEDQEQCQEASTATDQSLSWEKQFSESIQHPFSLDSVHCHDGDVREVTTNHCRTNCTVDYIFFSGSRSDARGSPSRRPAGSTVGELTLLGYLGLLTDQEATEMGGLPNHALSSDHFSLQAKFLLTPPK